MRATFHNYAGLDVSLEQPPTAEDRRRLRRLPLFAGAGDATVQDLLARTPINVVQRHQLGVREGAVPNSVMAVLSGRLALSTQITGEQPVVIGIVGSEELVMPGAAIVASPYPLSARAIEETRIAVVPLADLWAATERDHGFAMGVATQPQVGLGWDGMELLRESAELLRGYEQHHRDQARECDRYGPTDAGADRLAKAERNATQAAKLEAFLADPAQSHLVHDGLREAREDAALGVMVGWEAAIVAVREITGRRFLEIDAEERQD